MSVAFDAVSASQNFNNLTTTSWTHTPLGTPNYVRLGTGWAKLGNTTLTATYGGAAMTNVGTKATGTTWSLASVTGKAQIDEKIAPAAGAQIVALTWSLGGNFGGGGTVTYTGVNQTTASNGLQSIDNTVAGTTSSLTVTSNVGDMVSDAIALDVTPAPIASLTAQDTARYSGIGSNYHGAGEDMPGAASCVINWSWTNAVLSVQIAANILQSSSPPPSGSVIWSALSLIRSGLTMIASFINGKPDPSTTGGTGLTVIGAGITLPGIGITKQ